jgi:Flp pilus assembly protein TadG
MNNERGQSLVELAISFTVLMYLLAGAVEFGIIFFQFVQLRDAAQEGALYGSMLPTDAAAIETRVRGSSSSPVDLADPAVQVAITVTDSGGNVKAIADACESDGLTVEVLYYHHVFMPFMPRIIGSDIPLRATVTDTVLSPVCGP